MRHPLLAFLVALLAGCGVETATTAATAAHAKAEEATAATKTLIDVRDRLEAARETVDARGG